MEFQQQDDTESLDLVCHTTCSEYFDKVIGHIEDIVMGEEFKTLHSDFLEAHWQIFEATEENKLEYMVIFNDYTEVFEKFFVTELSKRMIDFQMEKFATELKEQTAKLEVNFFGEIFELLYSFTNFEIFKEMMLDYRYKKEGNMDHLAFDILVTTPICPHIAETVEPHSELDCEQL